MELVTGEAIRKICQLFLVASSSLQQENEKLKIKVGEINEVLKTKVEQMDKDLKAMMEKANGYREFLAKIQTQAEPKGPTHILVNGMVFAIPPVDCRMLPGITAAPASPGNVSQSNAVTTATSVFAGPAKVGSDPIEDSSLECDSSLGDTNGMNTDPSPREKKSDVEQFVATLPEVKGGQGNQKNSGTSKGTRPKEIKRFKCDVCEKTFSRNKRLVQHKLTHTKPFKCDICKKNIQQRRVNERSQA
ncbi:uncharacterized protein LOC105021764 [Esox lucius]|uniref:uncharacterized protein LOC105021764 n=1 Tax=Esox lucius TaxID=8010 RepID=UPI001476D980|nr:uncharacterized protein LOC105021764 [Esox lucius]